MNVKLFKINVVIVGLFFLIGLVLSALFGEVTSTHDTLEFKDVVYYIASVYFAFALVQTIIFLCKTLAKIEYRREVTFGDYFLNILQMMFFFIGIWILQPKVNKFIKTNEVTYP